MYFKPETSRHRTTIGAILALSFALTGSGCDDASQTPAPEQSSEQADIGVREYLIALKNAVKDAPQDASARWELARTHARLGSPAAAAKELRRALALGLPYSKGGPLLAEMLLQLNDYKAVLAESRVQTDLPDPVQARILSARGRAFMALGRLMEADETFRKVLDLDARNETAMLGLARLGLYRRDLEDSEAQVRNAMQLAPNDPNVWGLLGEIQQARGQFEQAEKSYRYALALKPDSYDARIALAWMLLAQDDLQGANKVLAVLSPEQRKGMTAGFVTGLLAYRERNYLHAEEALMQAVLIQPNHARANLLLAATELALGKLEQAETYARRVLARQPGSTQARILLGRIYMARGQPDQAQKQMRKGDGALPADPQLFLMIGRAATEAGLHQEAATYLAQAADLGDGTVARQAEAGIEALDRGEPEEAARILDQPPPAAGLVERQARVRELLAAANSSSAIAEALQIEKDYPQSPVGADLIGLAYLKQQNLERAAQAFRRALSIAPGDPSASHGLAAIALLHNDIGTAEEVLRGVLEHHPEHLNTQIKLFEVETLRQRYAVANQWLERAMEAHPQAVQPRILLGQFQLNRGAPLRTLELTEPLLAKHGKDARVLSLRGRALLALKRNEAALESLEALREVAPDSAEAHYTLARVYLAVGKAKAAEDELNSALALAPGHVGVQVALARLLATRGKGNEAREILQRLQGTHADAAEVLELEGWLAARSGSYRDAAAAYRRALKQGPTMRLAIALARNEWRAGDKEAAMQGLEAWRQAHPEAYGAGIYLANLYLLEGRNEQAVELYRALLKQAPDNPLVLNNLASLLADSAPDDALEYARRAVEFAPQNKEARNTLDELLHGNGETQDSDAQ